MGQYHVLMDMLVDRWDLMVVHPQPSPKRAKREMRHLARLAKRRVARRLRRQAWKARRILEHALSSGSGMDALAEAMVAPIRRQIDYVGVGRRIFHVADLSQGAFNQATQREVLTSGLFGHLWTADIHVSSSAITSSAGPIVSSVHV